MVATGNRCGHSPSAPLLNLTVPVASGKGGMPLVITRAMEYLERYFSSPSLFPTLDAANQSDRQQRSERREACVRLLKALLRHVDIPSLRVGFQEPDGFKAVGLDLLVRDSGLLKRRAERAHHDLVQAGLLSCKQPRKRTEDGRVVGLNAIRCISKHLWGRLGLSRLLERQRKRHSDARTQREPKPETKAGAALASRAALQGFNTPLPFRRSPRLPQETEAVRKAHALAALRIRQARPELSRDEVNALAWREVKG